MGRSALLALLLTALLLAVAPATRSAPNNPYGVMMFPNPGEDFDLVLARARGLGVSWYRPPTIALLHWMIGAPCPVCAVYGRSGLKLAVTIRNTGDPYAQQPSPPPDDLSKFQKSTASIVATMRPSIVAIENEENSPVFYAGGADWGHTYAGELSAGCAAAHEYHIACTNGGLTGEAAAALTWLSYLEHGQPDRACDFAQRALPREKLCDYHAASDVPAALKQRLIGPAGVLLNLYRTLPLDYVNFHWFGADSRAFAETAAFLAQATGKWAITNEFGQLRNEADPKLVRPLLRAVVAETMPLAIWYSVDTAETESLFGKDGRLRPTGWEFQRQLSGLR
jgi:hypothetical protein